MKPERTRTVPEFPSTSSSAPSGIRSVASGTPTTHGIPSSRDTIIEWLIAAPTSTTTAAAETNTDGAPPGLTLEALASPAANSGLTPFVSGAHGELYLMDHSAYLYLIDPQGRFVLPLSHQATLPEIIETLRAQLTAGA